MRNRRRKVRAPQRSQRYGASKILTIRSVVLRLFERRKNAELHFVQTLDQMFKPSTPPAIVRSVSSSIAACADFKVRHFAALGQIAHNLCTYYNENALSYTLW